MVKILLVLVLSALILYGCVFVKESDQELTFTAIPNRGNSIKLNGFYYNVDSIETNTHPVYFFYSNGVILDVGAFRFEELNTINDRITNKEYLDQYKSVKWMWGLYQIKKDSLSFEKLFPAGNYVAIVQTAHILNDTTFIVSRWTRSDDSETKRIKAEVYRFRRFQTKPDSVTSLVD